MTELSGVLADLLAEGAQLDALVAGLDPAGWRRPTPAPGWTVAHQIAHLAWTDEVALLAATDPAAFTVRAGRMAGDLSRHVDDGAAQGAGADPRALLTRWRAGRAALADALPRVPSGAKLPWLGPPMSPTSMATARLMETWAHGRDVADALGVRPQPTDRLRHVARLGVRTRDYAFRMHRLDPPTGEFRVELTAPDGAGVWAYGPADAAQRVTGPALDFCLLVTRRRHRADTALVALGPDADRWLDLAQAFAGPPGPDRPPATTPADTAPESSP